ncbi:winged helix-turn-helix domain-containing protein [Tepidimicrobium xylanilyticum]|uniref:Molybdate transport system regulatory protein n=2 Tax=Tepidimicrobium xylanilyticum TaxID=1123352 RepID=A0A1H2RH58_9FIRM|nr:LysR family transcriptional regulator [Tepidimicrobium xylanilyticum]GMG95419.1 ModE family transcriptional regulator [Tepidimicrobium xylanilyticum]SDW18786.1 molybdate transport system regulatory protein [Tepidimicrobium xylanilyticum]
MTIEGEKVFGRGPYMLLKTVDRLGSLNKACKELNMSYSKAWAIINRAEKLLGYNLLNRETGGVDGGGSCLTDKAKDLIKAYEDFTKEAEETVEKIYEKFFRNI